MRLSRFHAKYFAYDLTRRCASDSVEKLAPVLADAQEEQRLYDLISGYLQQPTLYALPASQRQLMTLILRKLLASSTYAISSTLDGLVHKLETASAAAEAVDGPPAWRPTCRTNWSGSGNSASWKQNAMKPGAVTTMSAARSTGRRTRCWMRSAEDWNRGRTTKASLPYGGA